MDLPFARESPYLTVEVEKHRQQLRQADEHLGSVTQCCSELINAMEAVGSASRNLALVLERTPSIFQASSVVGALGGVLYELSSAEDVLAESLELSLHRPLKELRRELSRFEDLKRASERADMEAGAALDVLLHGTKEDPDERARSAAEKKRRAELARFDLARFVSSLQRRKGLALAEVSVAALCSLRAFYAQASHAIGDAAAAAHKQQTEIAAACERQKEPWDLRMQCLQSILHEREVELNLSIVNDHEPAEVVQRAEHRHRVYAISDAVQDLYNEDFHAQPRVKLEGYLFQAKGRGWTRRWFILDDETLRAKKTAPSWGGQLLRGVLAREPSSSQETEDDDDEDELVARLLLTSVRECDERYAFEIHSAHGAPHRLQAAGDDEANKWMRALREGVEQQLATTSLQRAASAGAMLRSFAQPQKPKKTDYDKRRLQLVDAVANANPFCSDCGTANPDWCVINYGICVCLRCSGVHRSLGTHVSKVRSLRLDRVSLLELDVIHKIGNKKANAVFSQPSDHNVFPSSDDETLAAYVRAKWRDKKFVAPRKVDILKAIKDDDLVAVLHALALGVQPPSLRAVANQPTVAQLLVHNGANPADADATGRTPLDYVLDLHPDDDVDPLVADLKRLFSPASP